MFSFPIQMGLVNEEGDLRQHLVALCTVPFIRVTVNLASVEVVEDAVAVILSLRRRCNRISKGMSILPNRLPLKASTVVE